MALVNDADLWAQAADPGGPRSGSWVLVTWLNARCSRLHRFIEEACQGGGSVSYVDGRCGSGGVLHPERLARK